MTDGALLLFNLVIKSYAEEAALLEAAANMMLYVINVLGSLHFFFIYIHNTRYLTTNDQEASLLFNPSVKLILALLSKLSHPNVDAVLSQSMAIQLCCALLHETLRTADDADEMQVCIQITRMQSATVSQLTHVRALVVLKFLCELSIFSA